MVLQLIRFGLVGTISTAVHIAVATILIYYIQPSRVVANVVGFFSATGISYIGNLCFVFNRKANSINLARFVVVSGVSLSVVLVISLVGDNFHINKYVSVLYVAIILPLVNFTAHKFWTFRK